MATSSIRNDPPNPRDKDQRDNDPHDKRAARIAIVEQHVRLENEHDLEARSLRQGGEFDFLPMAGERAGGLHRPGEKCRRRVTLLMITEGRARKAVRARLAKYRHFTHEAIQ